MRRWFIVAAVVIALAGLGYSLSVSEGPVVQAGQAQRGLMRSFIEERARTRLPQTYRITMPSDGRIQPITLEEGDHVSAGQVVARMSPRDLQLAVDVGAARVSQLEAQIVDSDDSRLENTTLDAVRDEVKAMDNVLAATNEQTKAAKARLELAEWDLKRIQKLAESGDAAEKELRDARFEEVDARIDYQTSILLLRSMEAFQSAWNLGPKLITQYIDKKTLTHAILAQDKAGAQATLSQLELAQQRGTLTSPIDGVVLARGVSNERVLPAGTLLLEIGRLEDLEIEVEVLTQDAVQLRVGQAVDIFGPAIGTEPARGSVARIFPEGFTKISSLGVEQQRVKTIVHFDAGELTRLAESNHMLGSAFRVQTRIYLAEQADAVIVPRSALFRSSGGQWQVFTIREGKAELTEVTLGLTNNEQVAIQSGVQPGELVVLAPPASLESGAKVTPHVLRHNAAR